ncbi:hypothetical protein H6P81_002758 [Aristolochia fimbriata]|uniref:CYCL1 n=1 Tax=Aristolochia fimbriata TaxID=158543 RepID=A0A0B5D7C8_ARIFI
MFPSGNSGGGGGGGGDHSAILHAYAEGDQDDHHLLQYYHHLLLNHQDDRDGDGESGTPPLLPHPCAPSRNPGAMAEANPNGFAHNVVSGNSNKPGRFPGKKRSGKKDRHSKICTARGPRDRRMRLSLDIARAFFDLQDLLGFDKASKTVGWLLEKSKADIKDLKRSSTAATKAKSSKTSVTTASSTSEGEATSGVDETTNADNNNNIINAEPPKPPTTSFSNPKAKKTTKASRKYSTFDPHAKESRAMARARARARTKEKLWERRLEIKSPESPLRESKSLEVEEPRSQSPDSAAAFDYHHHGVINTDTLLSLQNNDGINFFRSHDWEINIPETQLPTNNGDHHRVHERLVFGSPPDIRHHQPHDHFTAAHQHLLVKPWEGY